MAHPRAVRATRPAPSLAVRLGGDWLESRAVPTLAGTTCGCVSDPLDPADESDDEITCDDAHSDSEADICLDETDDCLNEEDDCDPTPDPIPDDDYLYEECPSDNDDPTTWDDPPTTNPDGTNGQPSNDGNPAGNGNEGNPADNGQPAARGDQPANGNDPVAGGQPGNPGQPAPQQPGGNPNQPGGGGQNGLNGLNGQNINNPLSGGTSQLPNGGRAGFLFGSTNNPSVSLTDLLAGPDTVLNQLSTTQFGLNATYQSGAANGSNPYLTMSTSLNTGQIGNPNVSGIMTLTAHSPNGDTAATLTLNLNGSQGSGFQLNIPLNNGNGNLALGAAGEPYLLLTGNNGLGGTGFFGAGPDQIQTGINIPTVNVGGYQFGGGMQFRFPVNGGPPQASAFFTLTGPNGNVSAGAQQNQNGQNGVLQIDWAF